jgi:hypothetical protein
MRQPVNQSRLPDDKAFAGRFYDILAYLTQRIDFDDTLNLSQHLSNSRKLPPVMRITLVTDSESSRLQISTKKK